MERLTTTPFGQRPVSAGLLAQMALEDAKPEVHHIDKWELCRQLCTARVAFGVTDRDLTVLNALLSFHPGAVLGDNAPLIVFPSNKSLSERAHGMAESTLRRHIAALVAAGLISRHDSPNGKRYASRGTDGELERAFGFDLRPLLLRAADIARAAHDAEETARREKRLREEISLLRRDALKLADFGEENGLAGDWDDLRTRLLASHKQMRRKLSLEQLEEIERELQAVLEEVRDRILQTKEMSGTDSQNERHHQNSNTNTSDLELCEEAAKVNVAPSDEPRLPLAVVMKACPDLLPYAGDDIRHWHQFMGTVELVRGMLGISPSAWAEAKAAMGEMNAGIVLAGILQKVDDIRSPGGYLRALTIKAENHAFSPGPMIMALLNAKS